MFWQISPFRNNWPHTRVDGRHGAVQVTLFGGVSNADDELARYFLPNCKTELVVNERAAADTPAHDLRSTHFNIFTVNENFASTIKIAPEQTVLGVGLQYRQSFWRNYDTDRGGFLSISMPISRIRNRLHFSEKVTNTGGGANTLADENVVANMKEAFNQIKQKTGCN